MLLAHGAEQRRLATVYLCVCSTLVFNIVFDDLFAGVLANRVYIITFCPELSTPQFLFHFGMLFEDSLRGDAFDGLHEVGGWEVRNGLYEEMHMVFVCSHLVESYLVSLLDAEAYVLQRLSDLWGEYVPSVFHWADEVVQEERFVMTLQDVFAHQPILARMPPQQSCEAISSSIKLRRLLLYFGIFFYALLYCFVLCH